MKSPRDALQGLAVPVNPFNDQPLSDTQLMRIGKIREAAAIVDLVLCELGGTTEGNPKGSRDLTTAATKLDECVMWALREILGS